MFDSQRIAYCPYCKTPFYEEEGTLCDCWQEMEEVRQEMEDEDG
jgi:uncharacterized Zn finger protein (UPF0148 family)